MKSVIVYLPDGKQARYTEIKNPADKNFVIVDKIETRANKSETLMTLLVAKGGNSQLFCGIPFNLIEKND